MTTEEGNNTLRELRVSGAGWLAARLGGWLRVAGCLMWGVAGCSVHLGCF